MSEADILDSTSNESVAKYLFLVWLANVFRQPGRQVENLEQTPPSRDIHWELDAVSANPTPKAVNDFVLTLCQQFDLTQLQRKPTREANILVVFFTNKPTLVKRVTAASGIPGARLTKA